MYVYIWLTCHVLNTNKRAHIYIYTQYIYMYTTWPVYSKARALGL